MAIAQVSPLLERSPAERRLLDAAIVCLGRYGYAKTTLDDIASVAGCGRATAYRYFPSKTALIARAVEDEIRRTLTAIADRAAAAPTLEAALTDMLLDLNAALDASALRFVFTNEPQIVLPEVTFARGDALLVTAGELLAPGLAPHLAATRDPVQAAAWLARIALVYRWAPDADLAMNDRASVATFVRTLVLPAFVSEVS
jgi:AcrR family transcriptional regulator